MKLNWKQAVSAVALSAMIIGSAGGAMAEPTAEPKEKSMRPHGAPIIFMKEEKKPEGEAPTQTPASTERGIKDDAIKGCGKCGVTSGREKAPDGIEGAGDAAADVERDIPIKGVKSKPPNETARGHKANTVPGGGTGRREGKPPKYNSTGPRNPNTALLAIGGLGALAAIIVAAGGNDDNPTSP